jgi:hypothetical protein
MALVWKRDGDHYVGAGGSLDGYRVCEWRMRCGSEWVTSSSRGLVGHFGSLTDAKIAAADYDEGYGVANAREQGIEGGAGCKSP